MPPVQAPGADADSTWSARVTNPSTEELEPQISADLVTRIGRGERAAEEEMVERYERGVLYLLKRRTGDLELALNLRQDTFLIAIEKLRAEPINEPERLSGYLRGVAVNLALAHQRKTARRATTADTDVVEAAAANERGTPFEEVSVNQVRLAVQALLEELRTPRDREILKRLYIFDEDREAICRDLGIDAVHFNRVLFRAKARFRELLLRADQKSRLRLVVGRSG